MSEESSENIAKSDSNFAPNFVDHHSLPDINFTGHCLIKNNIFITKKVLNLYISYTLRPQLRHFNTGFPLSNCLFWCVKLTKNTDLDIYRYTGYGIRFDSRGEYSLPEGSVGKNVITFGADTSLSVHTDNKANDILILNKGPTQGFDGTAFTTEALYPINFTQSGKKIALVYTIMEATVSCLLILQSMSIQSERLKNKRLCIIFR